MKRKGSLDADGCHMGYAKPGQAASLNFLDLPAGPRSYDELFDWPVDIATRAREMVQARGSSGLPTLKVVMTTAYSGIGMAELAACYVKDALQDIGVHVELEFYAASEINEDCHKFLGARHIFGNLLDRAEPEVWEHLETMQSEAHERAAQAAKGLRGNAKSRAWKAASDAFMDAATSYLHTQAEQFRPTAFCFKCRKQCRWFPQVPVDTLWLDCGGNTCTPFSSRGKGLKWFDPVNLAAMAWCFSMKHVARPTYILNECVPGMPASFFSKCFGDEVAVNAETFSPVDLGIPANRPRQYVIVKLCSGRPRLAFTRELLATLCFRTLECTGSVFLCASDEDVHGFLNNLALARHILPRDAGHPHQCNLVMAVADRTRMESIRGELVLKGSSDVADVFADVSQSLGFGHPSLCVPTIIRNSKIYSFSKRRLLLTAELQGVQGVPMLGSTSRWQRLIPESMRSISELPFSRATGLLGNSMHASQVGCCLFVALLDAAAA